VKPWKAIAAALVIFAAGLVTGLAVARTLAEKSITHAAPPPPAQRGDRRKEYLAKLDRELHLTAEQHQQAEQLLTASQERIKKNWEEVHPKMREEYQRTREEINKLLTPEQQELYKAMRARREHKDGTGRKHTNESEVNAVQETIPVVERVSELPPATK
jgi:hypothetical protein